jgi:hypothetical protein
LKRKCLPRDIAPVAELLVLFCVPGGPATLSFTRESDVEGPYKLKNEIFEFEQLQMMKNSY